MLIKRPVFSQSLVFGLEHIIFVKMDILKTLQRLDAATAKGSGK